MLFIDNILNCSESSLLLFNQGNKNICTSIYFDKKIKPLVITYAKLYNVEPHYIFSIIAAESKFKIATKNVNQNGTIDIGLMQINNSNFTHLSKKFKINNIHKIVFKPEYNIKFGTYLFAKCKEQFNDIRLAIDCYNKGPNKHKLSKNSEYVKKVKQFTFQYKIYQRYNFSNF